jgi:hypothetical protein
LQTLEGGGYEIANAKHWAMIVLFPSWAYVSPEWFKVGSRPWITEVSECFDDMRTQFGTS